jgi:hypothetical protein
VSRQFLAEATGKTRCLAAASLAQDMAKGRRTEIESMNGFIAKKGREVGIPAPTHEMIMALVQRVESGASDPKRKTCGNCSRPPETSQPSCSPGPAHVRPSRLARAVAEPKRGTARHHPISVPAPSGGGTASVSFRLPLDRRLAGTGLQARQSFSHRAWLASASRIDATAHACYCI